MSVSPSILGTLAGSSRKSKGPSSTRPVAVGGTGTAIRQGFITDLDPAIALHNELWYGTPWKIGVASQMMRDAHCRRSVYAVIDPLVSAKWDFKAPNKTPLALEIADFARYNFFECIKWSAALRHLCLYIRDGVSFLEETDDVCALPVGRFPLHPGKTQGVCLTGLHYRAPWTIWRWYNSKADPETLDYVDQYLPGSDWESSGINPIKANRLLRFTWEQEGANFAGFAPLRSAYGPWKTKLLLQIIEAMRHEREHSGIPTIKLPEGATDDLVAQAVTILSELRANEKQYLILPNGYEFDFSTTHSTTDINATIRRCNEDIAHNLNVGFMLLGKSGGHGSYALASTQQGQYEIGLENHARFIEDTFNKGNDGWCLVERLVKMNYGEDAPIPKLVARNMPTRDWTKVIPLLNAMIPTGALTMDDQTEDFFRDVLYVPERDPDTARELPTILTPAPANNGPADISENQDSQDSGGGVEP